MTVRTIGTEFVMRHGQSFLIFKLGRFEVQSLVDIGVDGFLVFYTNLLTDNTMNTII